MGLNENMPQKKKKSANTSCKIQRELAFCDGNQMNFELLRLKNVGFY